MVVLGLLHTGASVLAASDNQSQHPCSRVPANLQSVFCCLFDQACGPTEVHALSMIGVTKPFSWGLLIYISVTAK